MVFLPLMFGIVLGILAGLLPGLHPNALSQLLTYVQLDKFDGAVVIAASASVNTVLSVLPAIFLFIPEETTILSVLPGQRMVNCGDGLKAVWISGMSALIAIALLVLLVPVAFFVLPIAYQSVRPYLGPVMLAVTGFYLLQEKSCHKIMSACFVFFLSGFLGWALLSSSILHEPLFVSFLGLFALSSMAFSIDKVAIPHQRWVTDERIGKELVIVVAVGVVLGGLADLLPAVGSPAQLATFATPLLAIDSPSFLALTMAISISHLANSFVALHTIDKARVGSTAIIRELIGRPDLQTTLFFLLVVLLAAAVAVALLWILAIPLIQFLRRTNLKLLNAALFLYLVVSVLFVDGIVGLLVSIVAAAIGMLPVLLGVRRTHLMGFLIVPTLAFLLA